MLMVSQWFGGWKRIPCTHNIMGRVPGQGLSLVQDYGAFQLIFPVDFAFSLGLVLIPV